VANKWLGKEAARVKGSKTCDFTDIKVEAWRKYILNSCEWSWKTGKGVVLVWNN
jgi:ABC-type molybdenum transport system ATPase subunit/photorepair protein PhrA